MSQPIPITPGQPPQWAEEAANEISEIPGISIHVDGKCGDWHTESVPETTISAIIARHAPQAPAVSDTEMLDWLLTPNGGAYVYWCNENGEWSDVRGARRSAILAAMSGEREGKRP